jgi:hypothetical protein
MITYLVHIQLFTSPTDYAKDRLAACYHRQDRQCLVQDFLVAAEHAKNDCTVWGIRLKGVEMIKLELECVHSQKKEPHGITVGSFW